MQNRQKRQSELVSLLNSNALANQIDVVSEMQKRGYQVTQPSISRDFKELGVVKLRGRYLPRDNFVQNPEAEADVYSFDSQTVFSLIGSSELIGSNLVVVKTQAASANIVASAIDRLGAEEIAGTVAGDDTIFIAVKDKAAQKNVVQILEEKRLGS